MKRAVFKSLGLIFVAIGFIGIFLPLLPTTIFLIIASYFFMKSSPELNKWMLNNKFLGPYIKNFRENRGMSKKSKVSAISLLWLTISLSAVFFTENLYIRLFLFFVATGVTVYISTFKTLQTESVKEGI